MEIQEELLDPAGDIRHDACVLAVGLRKSEGDRVEKMPRLFPMSEFVSVFQTPIVSWFLLEAATIGIDRKESHASEHDMSHWIRADSRAYSHPTGLCT
jgi:hypothetical protein